MFYLPPPPIDRVGPVLAETMIFSLVRTGPSRSNLCISSAVSRSPFKDDALNTQRNRRRTANTTSNIMVFALSTESALLSSLAFEPESNHAEGSIIHAADFGQHRPSVDRRLAIAADKTPVPQREHVQHRRVPRTIQKRQINGSLEKCRMYHIFDLTPVAATLRITLGVPSLGDSTEPRGLDNKHHVTNIVFSSAVSQTRCYAGIGSTV